MGVIGIDLGGTKVLAAPVDGTTIGERVKVATPVEGPEAVVAAIATIVADLGGADRIGIGTPGYVDAAGVVRGAPNLAGWDRPVPLAVMIREATGVAAVSVDNDVNVATMGEVAHGAAAGRPDVLSVFMGTGVGGGLVLDGALRRGPRGLAGEIGHVVVERDGRRCACGGRGHMEAYAGRAAMEAEARRRHAKGHHTELVRLAKDERMRSGTFAKALAADDKVARHLIEEAVDAVACVVASIVMVVDVPVVVLGGGVAEKLPQLVDEIAAATADRLAEGLAPEVVPAALGDDAGIVGAATLATALA